MLIKTMNYHYWVLKSTVHTVTWWEWW